MNVPQIPVKLLKCVKTARVHTTVGVLMAIPEMSQMGTAKVIWRSVMYHAHLLSAQWKLSDLPRIHQMSIFSSCLPSFLWVVNCRMQYFFFLFASPLVQFFKRVFKVPWKSVYCSCLEFACYVLWNVSIWQIWMNVNWAYTLAQPLSVVTTLLVHMLVFVLLAVALATP